MLSKVCVCQKWNFWGSSQTLFWVSSYILSFIRDKKNYKTVFLRMSMLPSLPKSTLLTFVITWPVWLKISRHFLMPSKSSCFSFMEDFSNQLKIYVMESERKDQRTKWRYYSSNFSFFANLHMRRTYF